MLSTVALSSTQESRRHRSPSRSRERRGSTPLVGSSAALALAALWLCLAGGTALAGSTPLEYRTIVLTGDQVPGLPEGATFRWIGGAPSTGDVGPTIDRSGNTGFTAGWGSSVFEPHGLLRDVDGAVEVIAKRGDIAPGVGVPFDFFPSLAVSPPHMDAGRSSFDAMVTLGGPQRFGIWTDRSGTLELSVFQTDHPPGAPEGYFFYEWAHTLRGGQVVLQGAWGGHVNDMGFWREPGSGLEAIVVAGEEAPGTSGLTFGNGTPLALGAFQAWDLDDDARIVFHGMLEGVSEFADEGVWVERETGIEMLAREGDLAPGDPGARYLGNGGFRTFGHDNGIDIFRSGSGAVLFGAQTDVPGNSYPGSGIYTDRSGVVERVVLARPSAESPDGDPAPGFPAGVTFAEFLNAGISDAEHVAINAFTTAAKVGIWSDQTGELALLIATGDSDGLPAGWTVEIPILIRFVDPGYIVVSSTFDTPGGSSRGLLLLDPAGDAHLVAATGLVHEVRPGDFRLVTQVNLSPQMGSGGEMPFELEFTDGSAALIVARPTGVVAVDSDHPLADGAIPEIYPNPFRSETIISAELPRPAHVELAIYDAAGRRMETLASSTQPAGVLRTRWDGRDPSGRLQPSGVYFARLSCDGKAPSATKIFLVR